MSPDRPTVSQNLETQPAAIESNLKRLQAAILSTQADDATMLERNQALRDLLHDFAIPSMSPTEKTTDAPNDPAKAPLIPIFASNPPLLREIVTAVFEALQRSADVFQEVFPIPSEVVTVQAFPTFVDFWHCMLEVLVKAVLPLPIKGHIIRMSAQTLVRVLNSSKDPILALPRHDFADLLIDFYHAVLRQSPDFEQFRALINQALGDIFRATHGEIALKRLVSHVTTRSKQSDDKRHVFQPNFASMSQEQTSGADIGQKVSSFVEDFVVNSITCQSTDRVATVLHAVSDYLIYLPPTKYHAIITDIEANCPKSGKKGNSNPKVVEIEKALWTNRCSFVSNFENTSSFDAANVVKSIANADFRSIVKVIAINCTKASKNGSSSLTEFPGQRPFWQSLLEVTLRWLQELQRYRDEPQGENCQRVLDNKCLVSLEIDLLVIAKATVQAVFSPTTKDNEPNFRSVYETVRLPLLSFLHSSSDKEGPVQAFKSLSADEQVHALQALFSMNLPKVTIGLEIAALFMEKVVCASATSSDERYYASQNCQPEDLRLIQLANRRVDEMQNVLMLLQSDSSRDSDARCSDTSPKFRRLAMDRLRKVVENYTVHVKEEPLREQVGNTSGTNHEHVPSKSSSGEKVRDDRGGKREYSTTDSKQSSHKRHAGEPRRDQKERDVSSPRRHQRHREESPLHRPRREHTDKYRDKSPSRREREKEKRYRDEYDRDRTHKHSSRRERRDRNRR